MMNQKEVWDDLATAWKTYRTRKWPEVSRFLRGKKSLILDAGCGSGRTLVKGRRFVGVDFSIKMLRYACISAKQSKIEAEFAQADLAALPFKDKSFDHAICVATLHCMEKDRGKALKELYRVLKPSGFALITVWNREQPKFKGKKEDYVPWRHEGKTHQRYYYLYSMKELEKELKKAGFTVETIKGSEHKSFNLFPRNIIAICRK